MSQILNIEALLEQQRELKQEEREIREKLKERKRSISQEFTQNLDDKTREGIVKNAEGILLNAREDKLILITEFKQRKLAITASVSKAREMLALVNHAISSTNGMGNGKVKNQIVFENGIVTIARENLPTIEFDCGVAGSSNAGWQKTLRQKLIDAGYDITGDISKNICYKVSCLRKEQQEES